MSPMRMEPARPQFTSAFCLLPSALPAGMLPSPMAEEISLRTPWTTTALDTSVLERKLTEQRMASDQLRLLGTAVHVTGQGIAILTPAVEAVGPRVAFVNEGFCVMFGHVREDVIGQTPGIFGIVERHYALFDALPQPVFP